MLQSTSCSPLHLVSRDYHSSSRTIRFTTTYKDFSSSIATFPQCFQRELGRFLPKIWRWICEAHMMHPFLKCLVGQARCRDAPRERGWSSSWFDTAPASNCSCKPCAEIRDLFHLHLYPCMQCTERCLNLQGTNGREQGSSVCDSCVIVWAPPVLLRDGNSGMST
jgi:hypothetical protein